MAVQMTIISGSGLEIPDAYIKIDEYSNKNTTVTARIRAYVSREYEQEGKTALEGFEKILTIQCDYSDEAPNTKKQIYNHMKTLPEYNNVVDVLED